MIRTHKQWILGSTLVLGLLLSACGTVQTTILPPAAQAVTLPAETAPEITPEAAGDQIEPALPAATAVPENPTLPPKDPLAGLFYENNEGFIRITWVGWPELVLPQNDERFSMDADLSPDGAQVVYSQGEVPDLWIMDLQTGETRNLTNTPNQGEHSPQWWAGRPDVIVFASYSADDPGLRIGNPAAIYTDGSGYQVLDAQKGSAAALSPDGQTILYGCCDGPGVLHNWETGQQIFLPQDYGIEAHKLMMPAWAPDSKQVAWTVAGERLGAGGTYGLGVAVFDLETKQARMLHSYTPLGGSMVDFYLRWSPDGAWIAFTTYAEVPELGRRPSLWVARVDGSEKVFLGEGYNPVWSPDGQVLAFNRSQDAPPDTLVLMVAVGDWNNPTQLPFNGRLADWAAPDL